MTKQIKDVVSSVIDGLSRGKGRRPTLEEILNVWQKAVGLKASKHTRPSSLRAGRLTVNVEGAPWLYEMNLRQEETKQKLKKALEEKKGLVKEIHFRIGDI